MRLAATARAGGMAVKITTLWAFLGAFCTGLAAAIEYHAAIVTAATAPSVTHTVKIVQTGRTLYFSEHQWRQVRFLGLWSAGLGSLGILVTGFSLRLPALLRSAIQAFRTQAPIWDGSDPPPLPPSKAYRWFGVVVFCVAVLLMVLIVCWHLIF